MDLVFLISGMALGGLVGVAHRARRRRCQKRMRALEQKARSMGLVGQVGTRVRHCFEQVNSRLQESATAAGLANAGVCEWWQKAMAGESYLSPVYVWATTRRPYLTVAVPIRACGSIAGVIGADLGLTG